MAIEGPLRELGIHDVFQLLDLSRKTGRLRVTSALRDNEGTVYFRDGRVISASVRSNPHPLGAVLLRAGKVAGDDLEAARALQQAPGESRRLGEILVAMGVITQRELDRQVRRQVEAVVFELMSWQEGFFSFVEVDLDGMTVDATTTVTTGSRTYFSSCFSMSRATCTGVLPCACSSSTSGVDTLPSGRTGTDIDSSGLRDTMMFSESPAPMMYA